MTINGVPGNPQKMETPISIKWGGADIYDIHTFISSCCIQCLPANYTYELVGIIGEKLLALIMAHMAPTPGLAEE